MRQSRGEVYKHIFEEIYSQITDYVERLIADKLEGKYDKTKITNLLEEKAFKQHDDLKLIYWEKSGRFIEISYYNKEHMVVNEKVRLIDIRGDKLKIQDEQGNVQYVNYNDIVIDWALVDYK